MPYAAGRTGLLLRGLREVAPSESALTRSVRWAYYFVLVARECDETFLKAIAGKGAMDLEDFGYVMASSYGEHPADEVRDMLHEKYGFSREDTAGRSG